MTVAANGIKLSRKFDSEAGMLRIVHHALLFSVSAILCGTALAQQANSCADLASVKLPGVEITKAAFVPAGTANPPFGGYAGPVPQHCRVDGVINHRTGVDGQKFGIGFAVALPENWNGDFLMQGGGGSNGFVWPPLGGTAAGKTPGLLRGFAVASTDSGHTSAQPFDFSFMKDQQAMLDFAYAANPKVAEVAKQIIARYYGKPVAYSYFVGCSTGGREGMILSEQFPTAFNGIVSGAPARRTGYSNIAAMLWPAITYNQIAPKDSSGKPIVADAITDADRKLFMDALLKQCDVKDGVIDGMIFDSLGCDFDPAVLTCKGGKTDACLAPEKVAAIKKVFGGPKDSRGYQIYPGFLYDTGIANTVGIRGLLAIGPGPFGPPTTAMSADFDKAEEQALQPLIDALSTNLTTFSGNGGKLIFYHGNSDPWFSTLDTLGYYKAMADANGGLDAVSKWSRMYLVPGMGHCGGGSAALDDFDMLGAVVDWVEKGAAPESVIATGKAFPGRSRPLCPYPKHAQYKGQGNPENAENFICQ